MKTPGEPPHEQLKRLLETVERETVPMQGHQDPGAIKDCWRFAYDIIEEMLNECSHLAANTCPHSYGDEYGHQRCSEIDRLNKKLEATEGYFNRKLDGAQLWMDKQANELKSIREALKELIPIAERTSITVEDSDWREQWERKKAIIEKAKELIK